MFLIIDNFNNVLRGPLVVIIFPYKLIINRASYRANPFHPIGICFPYHRFFLLYVQGWTTRPCWQFSLCLMAKEGCLTPTTRTFLQHPLSSLWVWIYLRWITVTQFIYSTDHRANVGIITQLCLVKEFLLCCCLCVVLFKNKLHEVAFQQESVPHASKFLFLPFENHTIIDVFNLLTTYSSNYHIWR